jgi:flagellar hook-associated protein 2
MAGSVIDVNSLVTGLVAAERAPLDAQITRRESKATVQVSALANLKSGLSAFQKVLAPLTNVAAFNPKTAKSGDEKIFTVSAGSEAATGAYDIEVVQLAKAHQLASGPFAADNTAVGTGTLLIGQGDSSFSITIDSEHNTLADIRSAINEASGNTGVQATIVREAGGSRLVLTSSKTGEANAIRVFASGGDGGLAVLAHNPPGTTGNLTELQPAQDAHIRIATFDHYSSTNTIEDAIDDVTLELVAPSEGKKVSLNITQDNKTLNDRVNAFVNGFNTLAKQMAQLRTYTPATGAAGPLLGDAMLRGIEDRLRVTMSSVVPEGGDLYNTLASIGITKQKDGTLALDSAKFNKALKEDNNAVAAIFGSEETGIAAKLDGEIKKMLETGSVIDARDQSLQKQLKAIEADKVKIDARMEAVEERYMKQFTALDVLLSNMQSMSDYLTQQMDKLPKPAAT